MNLKPYMMQLQGRQYLKVPGRILAFREQHPTGSITTELVNFDVERGLALFKASVAVNNEVLATAYGSETYKGFPQGWIEKAETVAVGRALAQAGFGTEMAMADFHESEENKLSDAPTSIRITETRAQLSEQEYKVKEMFAKAKELGVNAAKLKAMLAERGYPTASSELSIEHLDEMIGYLTADF
jgi:hypothetical protein